MCIRDSSSEDHPIPGPAFPCGACRQVISEFEDKQGAPISCLLYTSDAADERSSVDLGGRRIIKKKKQ